MLAPPGPFRMAISFPGRGAPVVNFPDRVEAFPRLLREKALRYPLVPPRTDAAGLSAAAPGMAAPAATAYGPVGEAVTFFVGALPVLVDVESPDVGLTFGSRISQCMASRSDPFQFPPHSIPGLLLRIRLAAANSADVASRPGGIPQSSASISTATPPAWFDQGPE